MSSDHSPTPKTPVAQRTWLLLLAAWIVALTATLGALFIGEILGQTPCNLCWYQRIFMFPLAIILFVACLKQDEGVWRYAFPLVSGGLAFALYHSLHYVGAIPEPVVQCSLGASCSGAGMALFGWMPLPFLSFAAFAAIGGLLFIARRRS